MITLLCLGAGLAVWHADDCARASGPRGFTTVVIDAGHGGIDRGGGPGQVLPEKPYTLDTALRLQRALRARGVHTVMTRTEDVFVPLPVRAAIASAQGNAIFISIHYNSAPREGAHGIETYYYRSDSFGLATRLHAAQLASLDTEDRHVRRRGFFVLRRPSIPAVLCEGGYLTNGAESHEILNSAYRERWAQNIADAIVAQQRSGDPPALGAQPAVTTERLPGVRHYSGRRHGGSRGGRRHASGRRHSSSSSSSSHKHSTAHHKTRRHHHSE